MRKSTVKKIAETNFGFTDVQIFYGKDGWHIESNEVDNFISIDSGGIISGLNNLLYEYNKKRNF